MTSKKLESRKYLLFFLAVTKRIYAVVVWFYNIWNNINWNDWKKYFKRAYYLIFKIGDNRFWITHSSYCEDAELVAKGLLTRANLIHAITVGQFTTGPIFSSISIIGYQLNEIMGAIVSTTGIFLPSFLFVALLNQLVKKNEKFNSVFCISRCSKCSYGGVN